MSVSLTYQPFPAELNPEEGTRDLEDAGVPIEEGVTW